MIDQTTDHDPPPAYIRPSKLAKILGWNRPSVYYWLNRCRINVVDIDGHKLIPVSDLAMVVMTLQAARRQAHTRPVGEDE